MSNLAIVVAYNSETELPGMLSGLSDWVLKPGNYLVVIENSANPEIPELVATCLEGRGLHNVLVHVTTENIGFAPAVNLGRREALRRWSINPRWIVLLNPDLLFASEAVERLVSIASDANLGIASPLLLQDEAGNIDFSCARNNWTWSMLALESAGLARKRRLRWTFRRSVDVVRSMQYQEVDIASGAFMAINAELFGSGLTEALPMYLEDQEICIRAAAFGMKVAVVPAVQALHLGGASRKRNTAQQKSLRLMELAVAPSMAMSLAHPGRYGRTARSAIFAGSVLRVGGALLTAPFVTPRSERMGWLSSQLRLARWTMLWSMFPREVRL